MHFAFTLPLICIYAYVHAYVHVHVHAHDYIHLSITGYFNATVKTATQTWTASFPTYTATSTMAVSPIELIAHLKVTFRRW